MNGSLNRFEGIEEMNPVIMVFGNGGLNGVCLTACYDLNGVILPLWFYIVPTEECEMEDDCELIGWDEDEENDLTYYGDEDDDLDDDFDEDEDEDEELDDDFDEDIDEDLDDDVDDDDFLDDDDDDDGDLDDDFTDLDEEVL